MDADTKKQTIEMAPMQGYTDGVYKKIYLKHFSGIDHTYCPFVALKNNDIRRRDKRELETTGRNRPGFTPQIIASSSHEAARLLEILREYGHNSVNLNMGCPYPMETRRKKGAGLIPFPETAKEILREFFKSGNVTHVSVKTRLGLDNAMEFEKLISVFNSFPIKKIIIHPRTGKQLFKGAPLWDDFGKYACELSAPVIANGDIDALESARDIFAEFPFIKGIMLGRGILKDPFLPAKIKNLAMPEAIYETLRMFHDDLAEAYFETSDTPGHFVDRIRHFWRYFSYCFPGPEKVFKLFKKNKDFNQYKILVDRVFSEAIEDKGAAN